MRRWMVWIVAASAACGTDVGLDSDATISCNDDDECPSEWVCIGATGTCSPVAPETAPVTSIEEFDTERRYFASVPIDVSLLDLNASLEDPEEITLELEYTVAGDSPGFAANDPEDANTTWWPGTLEYLNPWTLEEASVQTERIRWVALADADADAPELASAEVDAVGDGTLTEVVAFVPGMRLRLRAVDETGRASPWVSTPAFDLGNETPVARVLSFSDNGLSRLVPIELELSDSSSDPVSIEIQFRRGDTDTWRAANIVQGDLAQILTSPEPRRYVVVWDSNTPLNSDPSVPQGIGLDVRSDIEIRVRATDNPALDVVHHSRWGDAEALPTVSNP